MIRRSILTTIVASMMIMFSSAQSLNEAGELFNQGIQQFQAENFSAAAESFKSAADMAADLGDEGMDLMIKAEQQWVTSLYNDGKGHYGNKKYSDAISAFEKAAAAAEKVGDEKILDASNTYLAGIKTAYGNNFLKNEDLEKALQYYDEAISVKPDYIKAYYGKGLTYKKMDDLDNMKVQLDKVLEMREIDPKTADRALSVLATSFMNAGAITLQGGDFEKAAESLQASVGYDPEEPKAYYYLALAYNGSSKYDEAIEAAKTALDKGFAQPGDAWFEIGKAYEAKGDNASACDAYSKVDGGNNVEAAKYQRDQVLKCN